MRHRCVGSGDRRAEGTWSWPRDPRDRGVGSSIVAVATLVAEPDGGVRTLDVKRARDAFGRRRARGSSVLRRVVEPTLAGYVARALAAGDADTTEVLRDLGADRHAPRRAVIERVAVEWDAVLMRALQGSRSRGAAGHPPEMIRGPGAAAHDGADGRVSAEGAVMAQQVPAESPGGTGGAGPRLTGGVIASLAGAGALVVFMLQNRDDVTLHFLGWDFTWPLWLFTILTAVLGAFVWLGLGVLRRHRRRKERRAERRAERG